MGNSSRVLVAGPLGGLAEGFVGELVGLGYAPGSREKQLALMRHLSSWLGERGLSAGDLSSELLAVFISERRRRSTDLCSPRGLVVLLGYLRREGVAPEQVAAFPDGLVEVVLERFGRYLSVQRGLAPVTVRSYVCQSRPFLSLHEGEEDAWLALGAGDVAEFVTCISARLRPRSVATMARAVRALLAWMWTEGMLSAPLAETVGSVATPSGGPPRALSDSEIRDLLAALGGEGPSGRRNEAMIALMWRLGLRAGEVAALRLADIDWSAGVITVRGKGDRREQLPLSVDVGELLAGYLRGERPRGGAHRHVFLASNAPHRPLGSAAVTSVAARALARAGITGPGAAHRLRHTAACRVLAGGGGLVEVGQLLRHSSASASLIYAKSDLRSLAVLARPWPGAPR
jgi:site-specific recombinase XerD